MQLSILKIMPGDLTHIPEGRITSSFVYIFKKARRNGQSADKKFRLFFYLSGRHVFLSLLKAVIKT